MQTPAALPAPPPTYNAADLIGTPASAERRVETSVTTGLVAITCSSLLLGLAILVLAAIASAGHDVPDANSFLTFP